MSRFPIDSAQFHGESVRQSRWDRHRMKEHVRKAKRACEKEVGASKKRNLV